MEALSIGPLLGLSILLGYFGGQWLDHRLGTSFFMPAGALLGMVAGITESIRILLRLADKQNREDQELRNSHRPGTISRVPEKPLPPLHTRWFEVPPPPQSADLPDHRNADGMDQDPQEKRDVPLQPKMDESVKSEQPGDPS